MIGFREDDWLDSICAPVRPDASAAPQLTAAVWESLRVSDQEERQLYSALSQQTHACLKCLKEEVGLLCCVLCVRV